METRNVYDVLLERGFIAQATHEDEIKELLGKKKVTFYTGYDPTADSLHVGHFLQAMAMRHLQLAGHRPIILIGGGTAMIGDPSGRSDMRSMMTEETIAHNSECFKKQLSRFIDFSEDKAIMVNNADWLMKLEYIPFIRDIGIHFSVNRMLTAECFKTRMQNEGGLSFLEFNYMIMQAYDFMKLHELYDCELQFGGDDQWSNIIAGTDLIRRKKGASTYGMTFQLLARADGVKMGKTMSGAVWLDAEKTSPYDFYQYWRNIEDASVEKCLALLTFLPMDEVRRLGALEGAEINQAKEVLAFEVTKIVHGEEEALKAQNAARELFGAGVSSADAPTTEISKEELDKGIGLLDLLRQVGLSPSNSEGRRLVTSNAVSVNDEIISDPKAVIDSSYLKDGIIMLKKGKKKFHQVKVK
ncbi:MAG: tyrosine--tRNA ligase [Filifactor alocis]|nr:tyrosine--tRNA ligase [Filifactor alocis]